jgi:hypothetical protein
VGINYSSSKNAFHAKVTSAAVECLIDRRVSLKKVRPGKDKTLGRDITNANGKWSIGGFPSPHGTFYAKVKEETVQATGGPLIVCSSDRSKKLKKG